MTEVFCSLGCFIAYAYICQGKPQGVRFRPSQIEQKRYFVQLGGTIFDNLKFVKENL